MVDISRLSLTDKAEIAGYIKEDTLETVNGIVEPVKPRKTIYTRCIKRVLDLVIGILGFIVSSPVNLIIAVITFFDVGWPIIFHQKRAGLHGKPFTIYKFRNMRNDTDANGELLPANERVTRWGKFVRKTSLDELLNFVSIIKGDMSVIGPRPLLDRYAERLNKRHRGIYLTRPGLECPTLHKVDHELTISERLDNYVWYVENCSFLLDVRLAVRLVLAVFDRKSTKARAKGEAYGVLGYDLDGKLIGITNVPDKYVERYCKAHGYASIDEKISDRYNG